MISFRKPVLDDAEMILRWRTTREITRFQYTDILPDLQRQQQWLSQLIQQPGRARAWVIQMEQRPIGFLSLSDEHPEHKRTSFGFYIGELDAWKYGGFVPLYFYNYLFLERDPDLHKVIAEVMSENQNVVRMHEFHGYRKVGTFRDFVWKDNRYHDVVALELLREDWLKKQKTFGHYRAKFEE